MTHNAERIQKLAQVLRSYMRTSDDEKYIKNFTSGHQATEAEIVLQLIGALYDGIAYGNWPWIIAELNSKK